MQPTSETYNRIYLSGNYYVDTRVLFIDAVNNMTYIVTEDDLISVKTTRRVFKNNVPEVGCCISAEIYIDMYKPSFDIPVNARMDLEIRLVSTQGDGESEWYKKGIFFIDTREETNNDDDLKAISIHGYDSMMRANKAYSSNSLSYPANAIDVVQNIASLMDITIENETVTKLSNPNYQIDTPIQYTRREILGYIAAMYVGNFIINDLGELTLIGFNALPEETNLLIEENGWYVTFHDSEVTTDDSEDSLKTFETNIVEPIHEVTVSVDHVQEGSGVPSPLGKNLLNSATMSMVKVDAGKYTFSGLLTFDGSDDRWLRIEMRFPDGLTIINECIMNPPQTGTHIKTTSFTIYSDCEAVEIQFPECVTAYSNLQVESGSSFTGYEPFRGNFRPIKGFESCNIACAKKNIFNKDIGIYGGEIGEDGLVHNGNGYYYTDYIKINGDTTYFLSGKTTASQTAYCSIAFYDKDKNFINRIVSLAGGQAYGAFTTPSIATYIRINMNGTWAENRITIQLEFGLSASTYEEYIATTTSVSWESVAGTVYDGTCKIDSDGATVLTQTHALLTLNGTENWELYTNYDFSCYRLAIDSNYLTEYTPIATYVQGLQNGLPEELGTWQCRLPLVSSQEAYFYIKPDMSVYDTTAKWKTYLSNNNLDVLLKFVEPVTYNFTSEQLYTQNGINNLFADCGDIKSITYAIATEEEDIHIVI